MESNRTFFKKVKNEGKMSLGDIFSEVGRKHTKEDTARVFIAGTELTTPTKSEMLAGWQKPFLFARFFGICALVLALCYVFGELFNHPGGYYLMMIGIPMLVPITILLLAWEMNIPRDISLMEVVKIVALGGILSLIATMVLNMFGDTSATWAGLIEEPAKLIVIYFLLKRKNRVYILDGILIGMAVGTGFAVMETLFYVFDNFTESVVTGLLVLINSMYEAGCTNVSELLNILLEEYGSIYYAVFDYGVSNGLNVALLRAFNAICSHGMYAALYGGGLLMAKGDEEVQISHLFKLDFLKYFAAAVLLHALNNSGVTFGLPEFFGGLIHGVLILKTVLGVCIFLPLLRTGVNQIVTICTAENGGRVTVAVNRKVADPVMPGHSGGIKLIRKDGPGAGQRFRCAEGQTAVIGRTPGKCNIVISDNSNVSGVHCKVEVSGGRILVTDLGSTNGTFVETVEHSDPHLPSAYLSNRRLNPYQPETIHSGATIYLGGKNCVFTVENE